MSVVGGDAGWLSVTTGSFRIAMLRMGCWRLACRPGLQRFAKPWWQRRALRIFRDESSLSANPHLWSSITEALDESEWFVLVAQPDAAASPWVNQEIEYWKNEPGFVTHSSGAHGWTVWLGLVRDVSRFGGSPASCIGGFCRGATLGRSPVSPRMRPISI